MKHAVVVLAVIVMAASAAGIAAIKPRQQAASPSLMKPPQDQSSIEWFDVASPVTTRDTAEFYALVNDPGGNALSVKFYYDLVRDTSLNSGWLGPVPSDEWANYGYVYSRYETLEVGVRAMDIAGDTSPIERAPLTVGPVGIGWRYPPATLDVPANDFRFAPAIREMPDGSLKLLTAADDESTYAFIDFGGNHPIVQGTVVDTFFTPSPSDFGSLSSDGLRFYQSYDDFILRSLSSDSLSVLGVFPAPQDYQEFLGPAVVPAPDSGDFLYAGVGETLLCLYDPGSGRLQRISHPNERSAITFSPVVNADGNRVFFGTDTGDFVCVDSAGHALWRYKTGGPVTCCAAIDDSGIVYVARSDDGRLYGYRQDDSTPVFTTRSYPLSDVVGCPVIDANGIIYTVRDDASVQAWPSHGFNVAPLWDSAPITNTGCEAAPCLAPDSTVVIHTSDDDLFALRCADGSLKWRLQLPMDLRRAHSLGTGDVTSSPAIGPGKNRIYVGSDNNGFFYAITVEDSSYEAGMPDAPWPKFQHDLHNSGWKGQPLHVGVAGNDRASGQSTLSLAPLVPNPFSDRTLISCSVSVPGPVRLAIYNAAGQLVRTLADERHGSAGLRAAIWNGRGGDGRTLANGIYFCRLTAGGRSVTRSAVLLR